MASTSGPVHRCLVRNDTTSLDPVGCCLALEGRLSSADTREELSGALRQASKSGDLRSRAAGNGKLCNGTCDSLISGPTCLSSQAHKLSADLLNAFQAGAAEADVPAEGERPCSSRPSRATLVQQDSLVEPTAQSRQQSSSSSSSSAATAVASGISSPPRPPVSTAIERTSTATLDANGGVDHGAGVHDPSCTCPPYAVKSTCGKRPNMEDTYALCPNICELPMSPMAHEYADKLPHRIAVQFENHCMYLPVPGSAQQGQATADAAAGPAGAACDQQQQHQQQQQQHVLRQNSFGVSGLLQHQQQQFKQQQEQPQDQQAVGQVVDTAAAFAGGALLPSPLAAAPDAENSVSSVSSSSDGGSVEKLHFFGVYDGHGGIEASQHCAQRLHYHLSKAVAEMASVWLESSSGDDAAGSWNPEVRYVPVDTVRVGETSPGECLLSATAAADDAAAADAAATSPGCSPSTSSSAGAAASSSSSADREFGRSISNTSTGNSGAAGQDCEVDSNEGSAEGSEGTVTSFCGMMEEVLRDAFLKTDEEFSNSGLQAGLVGSTAVVALVGTHRVWIANCGDSRAVLSRAGVAIQVTDDHKPEREDEAERVEKAGGQVLYWNGHRVMGVLAMSRAIGDHCLRPYVIPEPEISVFGRHACDELLLLASDGLWDVLSNQEATDLALRSIKRAREKGASRKAAARVAATVLTKAAVDRGSRDNITVVIIDLSPPTAGGDKAGKASSNRHPSPESNSAACRPPVVTWQEQEAAHQQHSSRPSSCRSASRPGSARGGMVANPFAAAAASPFSTAALGSSELPLPTGASSASGSGLAEGMAAAIERSNRSSVSSGASGRLRSGTGASSAFAAGLPASIASSSGAGSTAQVHALADELDSIDLSMAAADVGRRKLPSIDSMAAASSAAEGSSTTSSSLEEQPTIVDPPPCLQRQTSSSPFSACQGGAPFCDSD